MPIIQWFTASLIGTGVLLTVIWILFLLIIIGAKKALDRTVKATNQLNNRTKRASSVDELNLKD